MDAITVRRWIAASPTEVWDRILDLERLVIDDPALDLEDLHGEHGPGVPTVGSAATIRRRTGAHVTRSTLQVEDRRGPDHATVTIATGGERWLLTIDIDALPGDTGCGSDVRLHAERDPAGPRSIGPRALVGARRQRTAQNVASLLEGLAGQLEGPGRPVAARR